MGTNYMFAFLVLSLAPVFTLMTWIYFRDKYEKEPIRLILLGMLVGAIVILPAVVAESILTPFGKHLPSLIKPFFDGFVVAGFVEELFKFLVVYLLFFRNKNFNERYDGIVYAVSVSLGFAAVENVLYVYDGGLKVGVLRSLTSVPAHTVFGIMMGFNLGLAKFATVKKKEYIAMAFIMPWFFHSLYDFLLFSRLPILLLAFIPVLFYMWRIGLKEIRSHQMTSFFRPAPPPPPGINTNHFIPGVEIGKEDEPPLL
jgi:protease PrsW